MTVARKNHPTPERPFRNLSLYADLSQHTMQNKKKLLPMMKTQRNNKIICNWVYLMKILTSKQCKTHTNLCPYVVTLQTPGIYNVSKQSHGCKLPGRHQLHKSSIILKMFRKKKKKGLLFHQDMQQYSLHQGPPVNGSIV